MTRDGVGSKSLSLTVREGQTTTYCWDFEKGHNATDDHASLSLLMISIPVCTRRRKEAEAPKEEAAEAAAEGKSEDKGAEAEKTEKVADENPKQNSGKILVVLDLVEETLTRAKTLAALRNAGMKDLEVDDINLIVLNDLIRAGTYQSLEGAELMTCNTTQASFPDCAI